MERTQACCTAATRFTVFKKKLFKSLIASLFCFSLSAGNGDNEALYKELMCRRKWGEAPY